ncbi:MAG: hypothetical protein LQ338_006197 [Usnochroma carphineum]|nr:MAG: hypothetical protein LQ338_006197 [Usnochroma carphineum]
MSNGFFLGDSDNSDSGEDNLPYPKPLSRAAFLTQDFDPATYLSSLRNRHQTLEDLRAELRTRNQDISKELLDLVNENYQDFLSLGSSLQGGDEKVQEVRLGLLGFRREIEALKTKVDGRRREVEDLIAQRRDVRRQMQLGRALLDIDYRLGELERNLMIKSNGLVEDGNADGLDGDMSESDDESENGQEATTSTSCLDRHVRQYLLTRRAMDRVGPDHPSIVHQVARMAKVKNTLLLDLGNALRQSSSRDDQQMTRLLAAYRDLGEPQEVLKVLRERKP